MAGAALPEGWRKQLHETKGGSYYIFESPGGIKFNSLSNVELFLKGVPVRSANGTTVSIKEEQESLRQKEEAKQTSRTSVEAVKRIGTLGDAIRRIHNERQLLREVRIGSTEYKTLLGGLTRSKSITRHFREVCPDRLWVIENQEIAKKYEQIEKKGEEILCFHSAPIGNLLGIIKEGFKANPGYKSSTGSFELLGRNFSYLGEDSNNALHYCDELCFVIGATVALGKSIYIEHADHELNAESLQKRGYDTVRSKTVSRRGPIVASPPFRIWPRYLLLFRKVRSSDLWEAVGPQRHHLPVYQFGQRPRNAELSAKIINDIKQLQPGTIVRESKLFVAIIPKTPLYDVHLIVCPIQKPLYWDLLGKEHLQLLHDMDTFAKNLGPWLGLRLVVEYPVNPTQWLVHCHVVSPLNERQDLKMKNKLRLKTKSFVSYVQFQRIIEEGLHHGYALPVTIDKGKIPGEIPLLPEENKRQNAEEDENEDDEEEEESAENDDDGMEICGEPIFEPWQLSKYWTMDGNAPIDECTLNSSSSYWNPF